MTRILIVLAFTFFNYVVSVGLDEDISDVPYTLFVQPADKGEAISIESDHPEHDQTRVEVSVEQGLLDGATLVISQPDLAENSQLIQLKSAKNFEHFLLNSFFLLNATLLLTVSEPVIPLVSTSAFSLNRVFHHSLKPTFWSRSCEGKEKFLLMAFFFIFTAVTEQIIIDEPLITSGNYEFNQLLGNGIALFCLLCGTVFGKELVGST